MGHHSAEVNIDFSAEQLTRPLAIQARHMSSANWYNVILAPGVLREHALDDDRLVLWLATSRERRFQDWMRISAFFRDAIETSGELWIAAVQTLTARQHIAGWMSKLFCWRGQAVAKAAWVLPTGQVAYQCGERRNDLKMVWCIAARNSCHFLSGNRQRNCVLENAE
jgi:hypothetical protein